MRKENPKKNIRFRNKSEWSILATVGVVLYSYIVV